MLWEFFTFEMRFRVKSVSTYVYFAIWFAFSFLSVASESFGPVGNSNGKVLLNGPYANAFNDIGSSLFGVIIIAAIFGTSILRDFQRDTYQILFTKPVSKFAYLGGRWREVGHNPLGALSVLALLALLALQAGTGLFSNDDIAYTGPLYPSVSDALAQRLSAIHRLSVNGLLALIGLHVLAIAYHVRIKRDDLLKPMVTGWKDVAQGESTHGGSPLALAAAVLLAVLAASSVGSSAAPGRTPVPAHVVASKPAW